jgi:hypothetical protein
LLSKIKKTKEKKDLDKHKAFHLINKKEALLQELISWLLSLGLAENDPFIEDIKKLQNANMITNMYIRHTLSTMPTDDAKALDFLEAHTGTKIPL